MIFRKQFKARKGLGTKEEYDIKESNRKEEKKNSTFLVRKLIGLD
jgi:hypothetical protein